MASRDHGVPLRPKPRGAPRRHPTVKRRPGWLEPEIRESVRRQLRSDRFFVGCLVTSLCTVVFGTFVGIFYMIWAHG